MKQKYAAIDIGSNTILLLVATFTNGRLDTLAEQQRIPRLGQRMDRKGELSRQSILKATEIIEEFQAFVYERFEEDIPITIVGTSAVREAVNHQELADRIQQKTGLKLRVVDGEEEARLTFAGALSTINLHTRYRRLVIDIGGGSTELIFGNRGDIKRLNSFPMGSVRYSERFLDSEIPNQRELSACRQAIYEQFREIPFDMNREKLSLIGVEGTVTSLAHILYGRPGKYRSEKLNGITVSADQIRETVRWLSDISASELLQKYPIVMKGRADVFLGGLLILEALLHSYNISSMIVSVGGIRHGAILTYTDHR